MNKSRQHVNESDSDDKMIKKDLKELKVDS